MAVARFLARGCQVVGGGTLAASAAFLYWTRECRMYDLADSDVFFHTKSFRQFNPTPAPEGEMRDICIRHCDLRSIRPDIVEDARRGGTALIESLAQGIFGGMGYAVQRHYLDNKYRSIPGNQNQLWTRQSLRESKYDIGTEVTDHLVVLDKNVKSILFRAGSSPRVNPDTPKGMDGLIEIQAIPHFDKDQVEFKFKTVFFVGTGFDDKAGTKVVPLPMEMGHRVYTKLLMAIGVDSIKA